MKRSYILYLLLVVLVLPKPALAYLDAGSGSMLVQLLLGGVAGLAVLLKVSWKWILGKIGLGHKEAGRD